MENVIIRKYRNLFYEKGRSFWKLGANDDRLEKSEMSESTAVGHWWSTVISRGRKTCWRQMAGVEAGESIKNSAKFSFLCN